MRLADLRDPARAEERVSEARYPEGMTSLREGELVTVAGERSSRDGIVFHVPSNSKVIVAVPDRERGPVLRTVHPRTLTERAEDGADDQALRALIRRTPPMGGGGPRSSGATGRPSAGHARSAAPRTSGK
jgi:hypothetical protein